LHGHCCCPCLTKPILTRTIASILLNKTNKKLWLEALKKAWRRKVYASITLGITRSLITYELAIYSLANQVSYTDVLPSVAYQLFKIWMDSGINCLQQFSTIPVPSCRSCFLEFYLPSCTTWHPFSAKWQVRVMQNFLALH